MEQYKYYITKGFAEAMCTNVDAYMLINTHTYTHTHMNNSGCTHSS